MKTCSVEGCGRPKHVSLGLCSMHYHRLKRNGDPGEAKSRKRHKQAATCVAEGCSEKPFARDLCQKHLGRFYRHGRDAVNQPSYHDSDFVRSYSGAHKWIRKHLGQATEEICIDCKEQADEWSYRHDDPDEIVDDRGIHYSIYPEHYDPRCIPCHRQFDAGRLGSENTSSTR